VGADDAETPTKPKADGIQGDMFAMGIAGQMKRESIQMTTTPMASQRASVRVDSPSRMAPGAGPSQGTSTPAAGPSGSSKGGGGLFGCLLAPFGGGKASVHPAPTEEDGEGEIAMWVRPEDAPTDHYWGLPVLNGNREQQESRARALMNEPSVKAAFDKFDTDGSGSVDAGEIAEILKAANAEISSKELEDMLGRLDRDGSGELDLLELCIFLLERRDELQLQKDQQFLLDASFSESVWGMAGIATPEGRPAGDVSVDELRSVFTRQLGPQAGLTEAEFSMLLKEFGLESAAPDARIPLETLRRHEAFADPNAPQASARSSRASQR